jgi:hypothetical protein
MQDEKIFIDKDRAGRERRVTAKRVHSNGDAWDLHYTQPDGVQETERMWGGDLAVEHRAVDMLSAHRLDFRQAGNRGDAKRQMLKDHSMPLPTDPPIVYGDRPTRR